MSMHLQHRMPASRARWQHRARRQQKSHPFPMPKCKLLNKQKLIQQQLAAINGNRDPEALGLKAKLQHDLTACHHARTQLKPLEYRVVAIKTAVTTCEAKLQKTVTKHEEAIKNANDAMTAVGAADAEHQRD